MKKMPIHDKTIGVSKPQRTTTGSYGKVPAGGQKGKKPHCSHYGPTKGKKKGY